MTQYRHNYPRTNRFSALAASDGLSIGASESVTGHGDDLFVTLNNPAGATVVTQQRRKHDGGSWADIGHTTSSSVVHRMSFQDNMEYQWCVKTGASTRVTLTVSRAVPSSILKHAILVQQIPYSDGFPEDGAVTAFVESLTPTDLLIKWSAARAADGFWQAGDLAVGSNGLIYYLNPDRGAGLVGNQEIDPATTQGTTQASWVAIGTIGTNVTTSFHNSAAPDAGTLPSDLPSGSAGGSLQTEIRFYTDTVAVYNRTTIAWGEQGRWASGASSGGVSSADVTTLIQTALNDLDYDYFIGTQDPTAAGQGNFPSGHKNEYIVFTKSGTVNTIPVIAGEAYRCTSDNTGVGAPQFWARYRQHDYRTFDQGTKTQLDAAQDWITSFLVTEAGDDFGVWTRVASGVWSKSHGDTRYKEVLTNDPYAPTKAALHPVRQNLLYNLRRGSTVHSFPVDLPVGYEIHYTIPAYVDGNSLIIQVGNSAIELVAILDSEPDSDGNIGAYQAGYIAIRKVSATRWEQFIKNVYDVTANTAAL